MREMIRKNMLQFIYLVNGVIFLSAVGVMMFVPSPTKEILLDLFPIILASGAVLTTYRIYQSVKNERQTRKVWVLMFFAMSAWLIAEILWMTYELQGLEPYPSLADLFYLAGDIFLVVFFVLQINFLRVFIDGMKRWIALGALGVFVLIGLVFVYLPIVSSAIEAPFWEVALPMLYETTYLVLLIGATNLTLASWGGLLGKRWMVIMLGIWLYAFTNQIFFFAEWNNLYRPENQLNWLSILFDMLYIASYQVLLTGFHLRHSFPLPKVNLEEILLSFQQPEQQKFWILLSDNAGRTLFVDPRLATFLMEKEIGRLVGEPVGDVLHLSKDVQYKMLYQLQTQRLCTNPARIILNKEVYALFAMTDEKEGFDGDIYWIAIPWQTGNSLNSKDIPSPERLLAHVMRRIPAPYSPSMSRKTYVHSALTFLSLMAVQYGGSDVAQQFAQQFNKAEELCEPVITTGQVQSSRACQQLLRQALEKLMLVVPASQLRESLERLNAALGENIIQTAKEAELFLDISAVSQN